jgi:hypothetical protein
MKENKQNSAVEGVQFFYTRFVHYLSFMKGPILSRFKGKQEDSNLYGLFLRALAWAQSVERLNKPNDVQALASAVRALFELAIDILLLLYTDETETERYEAWKRSAKLNVASPLVDYFKNVAKKPIPAEHKELVRFCERHSDEIKKDRMKYWGKSNHPGRWTGNDDLRTDCEKADAYPIPFMALQQNLW